MSGYDFTMSGYGHSHVWLSGCARGGRPTTGADVKYFTRLELLNGQTDVPRLGTPDSFDLPERRLVSAVMIQAVDSPSWQMEKRK